MEPTLELAITLKVIVARPRRWFSAIPYRRAVGFVTDASEQTILQEDALWMDLKLRHRWYTRVCEVGTDVVGLVGT